ncbi:MAG: 4,5-DOPA dioxygenase extradiol [Clostridiales bacterium]|nr:4,5-DOPA dioxygenase extradiol [Clostridiales bacterium]
MKIMPVLFIGHGSPMNAIEENQFAQEWKALKNKISKPKAILSVSAHWFTDGTRVMTAENPETIYDMYGFPEELYRIVYKAKGAPHIAEKVKDLISGEVITDNSWGYDHGTWSVLHRIYPEADIPVFQLSVDRNASPKEHYKMGQELYKLREEGVLILGSGNVVHNLGRIDWNMDNEGYSWAEEFDNYIYENILQRKDENVIDYKKAGSSASLAFTTMDHYAPLLYVLGASNKNDNVITFNKEYVLGSLSMTSYLIE